MGTEVGHPTTQAALTAANLLPLMEHSSGEPEIIVGLLDGPVATGLSSLASQNILEIPGHSKTCYRSTNSACVHGTLVAGILKGRRSLQIPAICPGCTLLVRPIFQEVAGREAELIPRATPEELAAAIVQSVEAGVHVLNLSVTIVGRSTGGEHTLHQALDLAMTRGTLVVAAAGDQRLVGGSAITAHAWVIPVVANSLSGRPLDFANLGASIGKRGLGAPGERILSLTPEDGQAEWTGSSVATPFVTGVIALLWSQFRTASATAIRSAVIEAQPRRRSIVPPPLDAWAAYVRLQASLKQ